MELINIGSLNIDRTYRVEQFVQPGETIKARSYTEYCGGKGLNQSIAAARAGARVRHVGAVGADGAGLVDELAAAGVDCRFVQRVAGPTGHAVIQVTDEGHNAIVICGGANDELSRDVIDAALAGIERGDMVLLQNETANVGYAMRRARELGAVVAFNPSPMNEAACALDLDLVDLLIVNEHEASACAGLSNDVSAEELLRALAARFPTTRVLLTLGSSGSCYRDATDTFFCDAYRVEAVDTTGAGDTFCGYFLAALAGGLTPRAALSRASAASAIAVTRSGAASAIPSAEEVDAFLAARGEPSMR